MIVFKGFYDAYRYILNDVFYNYENIIKPRNMEVKEINNFSIKIKNPFLNLFKNEKRSINLKYLCGELLWYFGGRNDVEFISNFSSFWKQIANENGTCNSAYGNLIFKEICHFNPYSTLDLIEPVNSEWYWAYKSLIKDKDTRQAIIHFNKPWHMNFSTKDFPCTIYGNFHIRNNKLNFTIYMRSSDSIYGTTYDIPFFMLLQQQMWKLIKENKYYDLELGHFVYNSDSQHIYEKDYELVNKMLEKPFIEDSLPMINDNLISGSGISNEKIININKKIMNNKLKEIYFIKDPLLNFILKQIKSS